MKERYPKGPYTHNASVGTYLTCLVMVLGAVVIVWALTSCSDGAPSASPTPSVRIVYECPPPTPTPKPAEPPPPLPTRNIPPLPTTGVPPSLPTVGVPTALPTGAPAPIGTAQPPPRITQPPLPVPTAVGTRTAP